MRKVLISAFIGLMIGGVVVFLFMAKNTPQQLESAEKNSFYEVTSRLDLGGGVYAYVSTERLLERLMSFTARLREMLLGSTPADDPGKKQGMAGYDLFLSLLRECGLTEIDGLGLSSIALEKDLYRTRLVAHHQTERGHGLLWQLMEARPHPLTELRLLPGDTVLAGSTDLNLKTLWMWLKKEVEGSGIPELKRHLAQVDPFFKSMGADFDQLLDSLSGRVGMVLCLDRDRFSRIPSGGTVVEIPEPVFAIFLTVRDDSLFRWIRQTLINAKAVPATEENTVRIPAPPLPVPLAPVVAQRDALLIFASNEDIVNAMMATEEGGDGLLNSDEYRRLSMHMPEKGNAFRFISARLLDTLKRMREKSLAQAPSDPGTAVLTYLMNEILPDDLAMYEVVQHDPEGFTATINHTVTLNSAMMLPVLLATAGGAAMAVPGIVASTQKSRQEATMGSMKQIAMAIDGYIADQGYAPPGKSLSDIRVLLEPGYIQMLPLKDGWSNDFLYLQRTDLGAKTYFLASPGKDGAFAGFEQSGRYVDGGIAGFDRDIVMKSGEVVYGPAED